MSADERFKRQQRGHVLRCERAAAGGMTQQELAWAMRVPVDHVVAWEDGEDPDNFVLTWFQAASNIREETGVKAAAATRGSIPGLGECVIMRVAPESVISEHGGQFTVPAVVAQAGIGKVLAVRTCQNAMAKKPVDFPRGVPFWVAPSDDIALLAEGVVSADVWEGVDRPAVHQGFTVQCWRRGLGMTTEEVALLGDTTAQVVEDVEASVVLPDEATTVVQSLSAASAFTLMVWQSLETFARKHHLVPATKIFTTNEEFWADITNSPEAPDEGTPMFPVCVDHVARAWVAHGLRAGRSCGTGRDWISVTPAGQLAINGVVASADDAPQGVDFRHLDLRGANLTRLDVIHPCFRGMDLRDANFAGARIPGADLAGADLTGADLTGADLRDSDLTCTNFTNANLTNARSSESVTKGIIIEGAITTGWQR